MATMQQATTVAVAVDYENLAYGLRNEFGTRAEWRPLFKYVNEAIGPIVAASAYADWDRQPEAAQALRWNGCEPIGVETAEPGGRPVKNAADLALAVDVASALTQYAGQVAEFVLVSGDGGIIRVLSRFCHRQGVRLTVIGLSTSLARWAGEAADRVVYYDQQIRPLEPLPPITWQTLSPADQLWVLRQVQAMDRAGEATTHGKMAKRIASGLTSVPARRADHVVTAAKKAALLVPREGDGRAVWQLSAAARRQLPRPGLVGRCVEWLNDRFGGDQRRAA